METQQGYLLVVEDIPDILRLLKATLEFKGYRVVTARDGQEALDVLGQERPAMIITDILMPKMDGFNLVHRLRINPDTRDIPVVFLSATYVAPEDKAFAVTLGVTRFIEKPVDFDKFLPAISELLAEGTASTQAPLNEREFYDGYRKRLEIKIMHKNTQISRAEHLLETVSEEEKASFNASLHQALDEKREIQKLLDEIHEVLENYDKPE
ncbi:MAG: response regulator [Chloroflexota bacterium]